MSTIFACFDPDAPVANATIEAMLAASDYWQPDATSHASNRGGHCRLARASLYNTATSRLDSAIADGQGNLITANARLDNRKQLAAELGIPAEALAITPDSRMILSAYLKWGEGCPKHLLGDFAFVIWDEARRQLFCARDHFGVKALFYARRGHSIMASNEHNAFFTSAWLQKIISEQWLVSELWVIGNKTVSPYQDIAMLPPAHSLRFDAAGKLSLTRYWQLEDKDDWQGMDNESLIRELATRFRQAVRVRLESAYPLAAELSEGVDSNGVVGYAAGLLGDDPLLTLSYNCRRLVDDNRRVWEKTYQNIFAMLAMHPNLEPVWQDGEDNTQQDLQTFFRHAGGVMSILGGHFLRSRLAHEAGARVLLSGWGGDHCVSTYGDFYESELFKQGKWRSLHKLLQGKHQRNRSGKPYRMWASLCLKHLAPTLYHHGIRKRGGLEKVLWERARNHHPLKAEFVRRYRLRQRLKQFIDSYRRCTVKAHHRRELFDIGVEGRLVESELCGRLYRIEYRYPLLDVPLVELAYNMPSHLKIKDGVERYMFRRILEGVTTQRIQWRAKADVDLPAFDRDATRKRDMEELLHELKQSPLAARYCDIDRLERTIEGGRIEGWMLLNRLRRLIHIVRLVDSSVADIASEDGKLLIQCTTSPLP